MEKNEGALERLEAVVVETAVAVRHGNLGAMGDLAARTNAALAEISPEIDAGRLESLRAKALRNIIALEAAGRGIRAARRRLSELCVRVQASKLMIMKEKHTKSEGRSVR